MVFGFFYKFLLGQLDTSFELDGFSKPQITGDVVSKNAIFEAFLQNSATMGPFLSACFTENEYNIRVVKQYCSS